MQPELRRGIERWLMRRGVPQLVEGYTAERQLDTRAAPFIVAWIVLGTVLYWGVRDDWPPGANVIGVLAVLLVVATGWLSQRWLRGRRRWAPGMRLDAIDVFSIGPLVGAAAGAVDGSWREAIIATLNSMLGIGVVYVIVGLGLIEIGMWSLGRLQGELFRIVGLLSRTLPALLVLVLFLLFAAEIWEAAHGLTGGELAAVLGLVLAIAIVLVLTGVRAEMPHIETIDWATADALAVGTPVAPLVPPDRDPAGTTPPLTGLQRVNLTALLLIGQLIQSVFVALLVMAFLVAFGLIVLPADLQEGWIGAPVSVVTEISLLGEVRVLSFELLAVTALLGSVVGLYFTGLAVNDAAYRTTHFGRLVEEVRPLVAARGLYVSAIRDGRR